MELTYHDALEIYQSIIDEKYEIDENGNDTDNYLMAIKTVKTDKSSIGFYLCSPLRNVTSHIIVYENSDIKFENARMYIRLYINFMLKVCPDKYDLQSIKIQRINIIDISINSLRTLLISLNNNGYFLK
jgi:uncharacterized protein (DUF927 family)